MHSDVVHHEKKCKLAKMLFLAESLTQQMTIFTPTKGENFMGYFPKMTELDILENVGNIDPLLEQDSLLFKRSLPSEKVKFYSSLKIDEFFQSSADLNNYSQNNPENSKFRLSFFPPGSD